MGIFSKDNGEKIKEKENNAMNKNETNENLNNNTDSRMEEEKKDNMDKDVKEEKKENPDTKKRIDDLEKQVSDVKDQLLRKSAEFENYKRRTEIEFSNLVKTANEFLIIDLLPVLDDFERSFDHVDKSDFDSFYKGIDLIYNKFTKTLEQKGVQPIDSLNQPFNVNFHEAMMMMPKADMPPQTVIQELLKGYLLNDKVIRHTKVIVSMESAEPKNENE